MGPQSLTNGLKLTLKVIWGCVPPYSPDQSRKCSINTPKIIKTAITFDILGLDRQNRYQKIHKVNVYISFKNILIYLNKKRSYSRKTTSFKIL